jgi:hypothetical protein
VTAGVAWRRLRLTSPATAAALAVVVVLLAAALVPLSLLARQNVLSNVGSNAVFLPMAAVGLVVARRQPGNPIGWLLLAAPTGQLLSADAALYTGLAPHRQLHPIRRISTCGCG